MSSSSPAAATKTSTPGPTTTTGASTTDQLQILLRRHIQRAAVLLRIQDLATLAFAWAAGLVLVWLSACLIEHWVVALAGWARWGVWLALCVGSVWLLARYVAPLLWRRINPAYVAQRIEQAEPELKSGLVSWLQLESMPDNGVPKGIMAGLARHAARYIHTEDPSSSLDTRTLIKMVATTMLLLATLSVYGMFSPKSVWDTGKRLLMPWASIAPPARVQLVELQPGSSEITQGRPLQLDVKLRGLIGDEPVIVRYTTLDGQLVDQTKSLEAATTGFHYIGALSTAQASGSSGRGVQHALDYWIEAGDLKSGPYRITLSRQPAVSLESIQVVFPPYTGLPTRTLTGGQIEAIEGSKVTINASSNQSLQRAQIEIDPELDGAGQLLRAKATLPMSIQQLKLSGQWLLQVNEARDNPTTARYRLRGFNQRGDGNEEAIEYRARIFADVPPEVSIPGPDDRRMRMLPTGQMNIEVRAIDPDFGLKEVGVTVARGDQTLKSAVLLQGEAVSGRQVKRWRFRAEDFQAKVGERFTISAYALDNRHDPVSGQPAANHSIAEALTVEIVQPSQLAETDAAHQPPAQLEEPDPELGSQPGIDQNQPQPPRPAGSEPQADPPPNAQQQPSGSPEDQSANANNSQQDPSSGDASSQAGSENSQSTSGSGSGAGDNSSQSSNGQSENQSGQSGSGQGAAGQNQSQTSGKGSNSATSGSETNNQNSNGTGQSNGNQSSGNQSSGNQSSGNQRAGNQSSGNQRGNNQAGNNLRPSQDSQTASGNPGENSGRSTNSKPQHDGEAIERVKEFLDKQQDQPATNNSSSKPSSGNPSGKAKSQSADGQDRQPGDPKASGNQQSANQQSGNQQSGDQQSGSRNQPAEGDPQSNNEPSGKKPSGSNSSDGQSGGAQDQSGANQPAGAKQPQANDSAGAKNQSAKDPASSGQQARDGQTGDGQTGGAEDPARGNQPSSENQRNNQDANSGQNQPGTDQQSGDQQPGDRQSGDRQSGDRQSGGAPDQANTSQPSKPNSNQNANDAAGQQNRSGKEQQSGKDQQSGGSQSAGEKSSAGQPGGAQDPSGGKPSSSGDQPSANPSAGSQRQAGSDPQPGGQNQTGQGQSSAAQSQGGKHEQPGGKNSDRAKDQSGKEQPGKEQPDKEQPGNQQPGNQQSGQSGNQQSGNQQSGGQPSGNQGAQAEGSSPGSTSGASGESEQVGAQRGPDGPPKRPGNGQVDAGPDNPAAANQEYARQVTNLVLDYLSQQKDQPDPELLRELNWTQDDLDAFLKRWQSARDLAQSPDPNQQRKWDDELRALGLVPPSQKGRAAAGQDNQLQGLRDSGSRMRAPESLRRQFEAFRRAVQSPEK